MINTDRGQSSETEVKQIANTSGRRCWVSNESEPFGSGERIKKLVMEINNLMTVQYVEFNAKTNDVIVVPTASGKHVNWTVRHTYADTLAITNGKQSYEVSYKFLAECRVYFAPSK